MGSQQLWNWGLRRYMMKQMFMRAILMTCVSILITNIASAQEAETIGLGDVFTWARTTPPDWGRGALFAILGLFGALVTIFGLIGGAVPGTAGQAKIDKDNNLLEEWLQELNKVIRGSAPHKAVEIAAIEKVVDNYRDDIRAERWHQFWLAAVLYALLGAFFSALLAKDLLQALAVGAGWTALLGTVGLRNDYAERKAVKDDQLIKATEQAKALEATLKKETGKSCEQFGIESCDVLEKDSRVALKL
jgi:hypothetical protein